MLKAKGAAAAGNTFFLKGSHLQAGHASAIFRCMVWPSSYKTTTTWPLPSSKDTSFHNSTREEAKLLRLQTIYIPRG